MNQSTLTVFVGHDGQMIEVTQKTFRSRIDPLSGLTEYLPEQMISDLHPSRALSAGDGNHITEDHFDGDEDEAAADDSFAQLDGRPTPPGTW